MMRTCRCLKFALCLTLALLYASAQAQSQRSKSSAAGKAIESQRQAIIEQLKTDNDFTKADNAIGNLFNQALVYLPETDSQTMTDLAYTRRLIKRLNAANDVDRPEMLKFLLANPELGKNMIFTMEGNPNTSNGEFKVLQALRTKFGDKMVAEYPELAIAISVVHCRPLTLRINENSTTAPPPEELFSYYVENQRRMAYGIKGIPPELLIYVVDSGTPIEEMQWALKKFGNYNAVGRLFHTIRYDNDHLEKGTPKKITELGFTLPNIQRYGGVCADQAYYAVAVGKAIGVPTVYCVGRNGEVGHAWVGFFHGRGRKAEWNFAVGRYKDYQDIRGHAQNPRTRDWITDSDLALQAQTIRIPAEQRHAAAAFIDAAYLLDQIELPASVSPPANDLQPVRQPADVKAKLKLVETAVDANPGYTSAWRLIADLAREDKLDFEQKEQWVQMLQNICGDEYPDFSVSVLRPIVASIKDTNKQNAAWEKLARAFRRQNDLVAELRLAQGEMWQNANNPRNANICYDQIIKKQINDSPIAIEALQRSEQILRDAKLDARVPRLYQDAFQRCRKPADMRPGLVKASNWYRIGQLYATALASTGQESQAQRIQEKLDRETD